MDSIDISGVDLEKLDDESDRREQAQEQVREAGEAFVADMGDLVDDSENPGLRRAKEATEQFAKKLRSPGTHFTFDLETIPDFERVDSFGLPPVPEAKPPRDLAACPAPSTVISGTIDEIKKRIFQVNPPTKWFEELRIAEASEGKGRAGVLKLATEHIENGDAATKAAVERSKLLSVTPEYCSICAIGFNVGGQVFSYHDGQQLTPKDTVDERFILREFWSAVSSHKRIVGFNILSFDLPVIFFRSALLGVDPSRLIDMRPWGGDVVDLYKLRFPGGKSSGQPGKLKDLARLCGIEVPAGDVDGSQVLELFREDPQKLAEYVRSDVEITEKLLQFYSGYWVV